MVDIMKDSFGQDAFNLFEELGFTNFGSYSAIKEYHAAGAEIRIEIFQDFMDEAFYIGINWSCVGSVNPCKASAFGKMFDLAVYEACYIVPELKKMGYRIEFVED